MNTKSISKIFVAIFLILIATAACSSSNNVQGDKFSGNAAQPGGSSAGGPEVGNLPAPQTSQSSSQNDPAQLHQPGADFFEDKAEWNSLSPDVQAILKQQQQALINQWIALNHGQSSSSFSSNDLNPKVFYETLTETLCLDGSEFICVSKPQDNEGTAADTYTVEGGIELCQVQSGVYPARAGWITVVPPGRTYNILLSRVRNCPMGDSKDVYSFSQSIDTPGPGPINYLVSVNSIKVGGTPDSKTRTLVRQGAPKIRLVKLSPADGLPNIYPQDPAKRFADLCTDPNCQGLLPNKVSLPAIKATIELTTPGTNVSVKIMNYSDDGSGKLDPNKLNYVSAGDEFNKSGLTATKTATLRLLPGKNHFKIVAETPNLPPPFELPEVVVDNIDPMVGVRILSPKEKVIESHSKVGTAYLLNEVSIQFCLVNLPNLEGRNGSEPNKCISNWEGDKPRLRLNGVDVTDHVTCDNASGICNFTPIQAQKELPKAPTCTIDPETQKLKCSSDGSSSAGLVMLGNNIFTISALLPKKWDDPALPVSHLPVPTVVTSSFGYGMSNKPNLDNGILKQGLLQGALTLEIDKKILTQDLKKAIITYLGSKGFKDTLKETLGSKGTPSGLSCTVSSGKKITDDGKTSISLKDDFEVGNATIDQWEVRDYPAPPPNTYTIHKLVLGITVQDLYGTMDIATGPLDVDIFRNVKINIKSLKIMNLLAHFEPGANGLQKLVIEKGSSPALMVEAGDRDPSGSGLILIPQWSDRAAVGLIKGSFIDGIEANIFCFLGSKVSDPVAGLPRWENDLQQITKYKRGDDSNPLRQNIIDQLVLGQPLNLDLAFNPLRASSIQFDRQGLQLVHMPLRIAPGKEILEKMDLDFLKSVGSLSRVTSLPDVNVVYPPWNALVNCDAASPFCRKYKFPIPAEHTYQEYNIGVQVSEDLINQALFAANLTGLLNLNIDPEFFINNQFGFIRQVTPTIKDFFDPSLQIDANQNGFNDDSNLPVRLSLKTDPALAPHLHFLGLGEISALVNNVKKSTGKVDLNPALKYFRLTLSNVEVSIYPLKPKSYATYCVSKEGQEAPDTEKRGTVPQLDLADALQTGAPQKTSFFFPCTMNPDPMKYEVQSVPTATEPLDPSTVPLVRLRVDLAMHGVIEGSYDEVLGGDKYTTDKNGATWPTPKNASPTPFVRARILSTNFGPSDSSFEAFTYEARVIENNTGILNIPVFEKNNLEKQLKKILQKSLGSAGENFNEIRISLPKTFPGTNKITDLTKTLQEDFGIDYFKLLLGDESKPDSLLLPQAMIDESPWPADLNLLSVFYICSKEERNKGNCPALPNE